MIEVSIRVIKFDCAILVTNFGYDKTCLGYCILHAEEISRSWVMTRDGLNGIINNVGHWEKGSGLVERERIIRLWTFTEITKACPFKSHYPFKSHCSPKEVQRKVKLFYRL